MRWSIRALFRYSRPMDTAYGIMHCRSEISDRSTCHLEATATAVGHHAL